MKSLAEFLSESWGDDSYYELAHPHSMKRLKGSRVTGWTTAHHLHARNPSHVLHNLDSKGKIIRSWDTPGSTPHDDEAGNALR